LTGSELESVVSVIADLESKKQQARKRLEQLGVFNKPLDFDTQEKFKPSFMELDR
jgi:hypothetical protein